MLTWEYNEARKVYTAPNGIGGYYYVVFLDDAGKRWMAASASELPVMTPIGIFDTPEESIKECEKALEWLNVQTQWEKDIEADIRETLRRAKAGEVIPFEPR